MDGTMGATSLAGDLFAGDDGHHWSLNGTRLGIGLEEGVPPSVALHVEGTVRCRDLLTLSDAAAKCDVRPVEGEDVRSVVRAVADMKVVWFRYDSEEGDSGRKMPRMGFLADQVRQVLPQVVDGRNGMSCLDPSQVLAALTLALQHATSEIEDLKVRMERAGI
jgi:Chaperone of endosialidase